MIEHFFIAGAQRSGTSYLYHLLAEHPEIEMAKPLRPEPKFFLIDDLFSRGLEHYARHFFDGKAGAWLRGEKTVSYMESETAARRIARCFPKAKIIFLLRDPVARAVSNYWFSVENGLEKVPMSEAFLHEDERWRNYDHARISGSPYAYLRRGRYIDYISVYLRHFPEEKIGTFLYEQLVASPRLLREVYAFLGVTPDFIPASLNQIVNKTEKPDAPLSPDLKRYLLDYFAESNARLADRFGLDLHEWACA